MQNLALRLKQFRHRAGLSQKAVAEKIGVAPSTYRDWEYGKQISGEPYMKLAQVYGVSLVELLEGSAGKGSTLLRQIDELEALVKTIKKTAASL